jgi:hypothetical protein
LCHEVEQHIDARQRIGETNAELSQIMQDQATEIKRLQSVESAVCQSIFGPEATYSRLAEIPKHVERWISEGAYLGAFMTMAHASSLYRGLDLEAVSQGFTADRTSEEIDAIEDEVRPHAQTVRDSIDPQVIMGLKQLPPEEED